MCAGMRFLSCVNIRVSLQVIKVQESFPTVWTPVSLLPIVPTQVHVEVNPPYEFPFAEVALERFLSRVNSNVRFHIQLCEKALAADLANKRFDPSVHHLKMFGETESVDEALPTFLADMDSSIAVDPVVPFEAFGIGEVFPTESAGKRPHCVQADVALQGGAAAEDLTTLPALILQQAAADEGQRL